MPVCYKNTCCAAICALLLIATLTYIFNYIDIIFIFFFLTLFVFIKMVLNSNNENNEEPINNNENNAVEINEIVLEPDIENNMQNNAQTNNSQNNIHSIMQYSPLNRKDSLSSESDDLSPGSKILINECSICLENIYWNDCYIELDCKHIFHNECITKWFVQCIYLKNKKTCPNCIATSKIQI